MGVKSTKKGSKLAPINYKKIGYKLPKTPINRGSLKPTNPKPPVQLNQPTYKSPTPTSKGSGVVFTLPVYGQGGNAQQYPQYNTTPLFVGSPEGYAAVNQSVHNIHKDNPQIDTLNPFKKINEFVETVNDPKTWLTVVGFLIAIVFIIVSLFGIVTNAKSAVIQSTFGQNAAGLTNTFKKKGK